MNFRKIFECSAFCINPGWGILAGLIVLFLFLSHSENTLAKEAYSDTVLNYILTNPELTAARSSLQESQFRKDYSGAWADPKLGLTFGSKQMINLSQPIPNLGRQSVNVRIAEAEVRIAELRYELLVREIRKQVFSILYQLQGLEQSLIFIREEQALLSAMRQTTLSQYETGLVSQQDPIRVKIAEAELAMRLNGYLEQKSSLLAELTKLSGTTTPSIVGTLNLKSLNIPPALESRSRGLAQLNDYVAKFDIITNPAVLIAETEYQKARLRRSATNVIRQPEFDLGAEYDLEMSTIRGMVGMSLPVWIDKNSNRIAEADLGLESVSQNYQDVLLDTKFQLAKTQAKTIRLIKNIDLLSQTVLPQAQAAFSSAEASYLNNKITFSEWLEAKTRVLETKIAMEQMGAELGITRAELEQIIGPSDTFTGLW